jgi:hypothetical protein
VPISAKNTTKNTKRKPRKTRPLTSGVTVKEASICEFYSYILTL